MAGREFPAPVFDDAVDARRAVEEAKAARIEAKRRRVREAFPEMTAVADQFRAVFGEDTRLRWAAENGNIIGPVPEDVRREHEQRHGRLRDVGKEDL